MWLLRNVGRQRQSEQSLGIVSLTEEDLLGFHIMMNAPSKTVTGLCLDSWNAARMSQISRENRFISGNTFASNQNVFADF